MREGTTGLPWGRGATACAGGHHRYPRPMSVVSSVRYRVVSSLVLASAGLIAACGGGAGEPTTSPESTSRSANVPAFMAPEVAYEPTDADVEEPDATASRSTPAAKKSTVLADGPGTTTALVVTADQARTLAKKAVVEQSGISADVELSPAITATWPVTAPVVLFVAYPLEPDPASTVSKVGQPYAVLVDLETATATVERVHRSRNIKAWNDRRESVRVREGLAAAEQAMVEIVTGQRKLDGSLGTLDGYRAWFNDHLDVTTDLVRRYPGAMRWYRDPSRGGE